MQADVFYVPVSARLDFALAAAALAKSGLHNEIIMAVLLGMITDVDGKVDIMPVGHHCFYQSPACTADARSCRFVMPSS